MPSGQVLVTAGVLASPPLTRDGRPDACGPVGVPGLAVRRASSSLLIIAPERLLKCLTRRCAHLPAAADRAGASPQSQRAARKARSTLADVRGVPGPARARACSGRRRRRVAAGKASHEPTAIISAAPGRNSRRCRGPIPPARTRRHPAARWQRCSRNVTAFRQWHVELRAAIRPAHHEAATQAVADLDDQDQGHRQRHAPRSVPAVARRHPKSTVRKQLGKAAPKSLRETFATLAGMPWPALRKQRQVALRQAKQQGRKQRAA